MLLPLALSTELPPWQNVAVPDMVGVAGTGFTCTTAEAVTVHVPFPIEYVIVEVPPLTAVTFPPSAFTVAMAVLLLLQVPPKTPLVLYVAWEPIHKGVLPPTVPGFWEANTVTVAVVGQLLLLV